ncbi:alpha/beta hydrolase [Aquipseudomonas alcaligenes]|nr:alpha/beta hydrolase [Pseudomonas alcaligenes]
MHLTWKLIALPLSLALLSCSSPKPLILMATPVIYEQAAIDPFAHLTENERVPSVSLFYATNRRPETEGYGNQFSDKLHLGRSDVRLGSPQDNWPELRDASLSATRTHELPLSLNSVREDANLPVHQAIEAPLSAELQRYVDVINLELTKARDKEIIIYVHGAKVDFANANQLTAELVHFAGRDFVGLAFSWPSHQNILSYLIGIDVSRARQSSHALGQLIELLARHTAAERINLVAYSAGGRVASLALNDLSMRAPTLDSQQLQSRYRIGAVIFAAADVPEELFEERLKGISKIAEQVMITISDKDDALMLAHQLMPGGYRIGTIQAEASLKAFAHRNHLNNVTLLDVSSQHKTAGGIIAGHHYWYRHPWVSSDVILLMRTNLPPAQRALTISEHPAVWYMPPDYPGRVRDATRQILRGQW